jgi:hypothetical protein
MTSALRKHRRFAPSRFLRDANACGQANDRPQPRRDAIPYQH